MARMPQIDPLAVVATGVETGKVAGAAGLATRVRTKFLGRAKGRIETLIPGAWVNTTIRSGRIDCTGPGRAIGRKDCPGAEACKGVEKVNTNSSAAMIGWEVTDLRPGQNRGRRYPDQRQQFHGVSRVYG